jgi:hypothetical protein
MSTFLCPAVRWFSSGYSHPNNLLTRPILPGLVSHLALCLGTAGLYYVLGGEIFPLFALKLMLASFPKVGRKSGKGCAFLRWEHLPEWRLASVGEGSNLLILPMWSSLAPPSLYRQWGIWDPRPSWNCI